MAKTPRSCPALLIWERIGGTLKFSKPYGFENDAQGIYPVRESGESTAARLLSLYALSIIICPILSRDRFYQHHGATPNPDKRKPPRGGL